VLPKVDKGVPPPKENHTNFVDFFKGLEIGDSFECDENMYNRCKQWFYRNDKSIRVARKSTGDDLIRVWILEKGDSNA